MSTDLNTLVRPLANVCLQIRSDIVFTPRYSKGRIAYYVVEDPLTSRFFRLGVAEHYLARQMNGQTTIQVALSKLSSGMSKHRLSEEDAIGFCHWLVEMDLAYSQCSFDIDRLDRRSRASDKIKLKAQLNPLGLRIPLLTPNRILERLLVVCGWLFSKWCVGLCVLAIYVGILYVVADWQRFAEASMNLFSIENSLWLVGSWLALKLIHELAHGLVCKRLGGSVREAGLQCNWFVPMPYVDVTSCWKFPSRWSRIYVAAAGIYAEFGVAAIAAIVWGNTDAGLLNHLTYNVVLMASMATFLFNANPLMKLDGYYILSDIVGIPNLYQHGQRRVQGWFERIVLGIPTTEPHTDSKGKSCFISVYGWLSFFWRVGFSIGLTVALSRNSGQAAMWIAAVLTCVWAGPWLRQFFRFLISGRPGIPPRRFRVVALLGFALASVSSALAWLPWPSRMEAPAIVEYTNPVKIRAAGAGRLVSVHVTAGQWVEKDALLLSLENRELAAKTAELRLQIQQCEVRERRFQQKSQLALKQAEEEQRQALSIELETKVEELADLQVRAPHAGVVEHPDLQSLVGRFFHSGDELIQLAKEAEKELRVAISQQDFDHFSHQIGCKIRIYAPGSTVLDGQLREINPRASLTPIAPALAAVHGGSLPVRSVSDRKEQSSGKEVPYELLSPYLEGIVSLDEAVSLQVKSGQRVKITSSGRRESIGEHLYRWLDFRMKSQSDGNVLAFFP